MGLNGRVTKLEDRQFGGDQPCIACGPIEFVQVAWGDPEPEPLAPCLRRGGCDHPRRMIVREPPPEGLPDDSPWVTRL